MVEQHSESSRRRRGLIRRVPILVALTLISSSALVALSVPDVAEAEAKPVLSAGVARARQCHAARAAGARGVDGFNLTASATGLIRVRLEPIGSRAVNADWDVAVFDRADGRLVSASAGPRSYELADGFVTAGDRLWVQGCRYAGNAARVRIRVDVVPTSTGNRTAGPTQLVSVQTETRAAKRRLVNLGVDTTESATARSIDVVLYGQADVERLRRAGFRYTVKIPDLTAYSERVRRADRAYASQNESSGLPSGRTSYRRLADYEYEMKNLARRYPNLVKLTILSRRTIEGRDIAGIEIAQNARNTRDGKPIFLNMAVHHAREWPAGEHAMEWAYELINGYGRTSRTTRLVRATRNIVVPIVNPDGFSVSREAPLLGDFSLFDYENKRKNCNPQDAPTAELRSGPCPQNPAGRLRGTDLNRNYAGFWGGPGASPNWSSDTYRGSAPFSEPETQAIRQLISTRQVTNLITNHTYGNLVLRPPGVQAVGDPVDEPLMASIGAEMTSKNDYANQRAWQLYDTTGSTEDWSYWIAGGLGYTFEIGPDGFHPPFEDAVVGEYLGRAPAAGAGLGGNREAYFVMLESTANPAHHSTITGRAPRGWTLRVHKEFQSPTSPVIQPDGSVGEALLYRDELDSRYTSTGGRFNWNVNPSTRPLVAGRYGRLPTGPPQGPITLANPPGIPAANDGDPLSGPNERVPFTVLGQPQVDNAITRVRIQWTDPDVDWDLYIVDSEGDIVGQAATFGTNFEVATIPDLPGGQYQAVIVNFEGGETDDWTTGSVSFAGPQPAIAGVREAWTFTCERPNGRIASVRQVIVDRGEIINVGAACRPQRERAAR